MRNVGEEYVTRSGTVKKRRQLKPGCGGICRNKCQLKLTEEERSTIFHTFWAMGCLSQQRNYLCKVVQKKEKKTTQIAPGSQRSHTYVYYLDVNEKHIQVCTRMFLDTLNVVATAITKSTNIGTEQKRLYCA